jgi:hypothetical protein
MTKKIKSVVYAVGGFDESKPDNNILSYEYYTKEELAGLAEAEAKETQRQAILDRLGLTADEAKLILG